MSANTTPVPPERASRRVRAGKVHPHPGLLLVAACGLLFAQAEDAASKAARAAEAMNEGRFPQAITLYSDLVKGAPDNPGLVMNLALALRGAGREREAIIQLRRVLKLDPEFTPAWLVLGMAHLKLGEADQALAPLKKAVEAEPRNPTAQLEMANALYQLRRFEEAAGHYVKTVELDQNQPVAWQRLGLSYAALGERTLEELERIAPDSAYWYALVGGLHAERMQLASAYWMYRKALEKNPGLRGIHEAIAEIYKGTGNPEWAAKETEKERQLPPPDCAASKLECEYAEDRHWQLIEAAKPQRTPESLYWQAQAYEALAFRSFSQLTELPPSSELHALVAEAYEARGRHRDAVDEWQAALKDNPGDPHLRKQLARSLWLDRDYKAALPLLEKLLEAEPGSADLNHALGDTLLELGEAAKAVPLLEKAVKAGPSASAAAQAALGRAYLRTGQPRRAIAPLRAALPGDEDGSVHADLASAYEKTAQPAPAKEARQKSREIAGAPRALRLRPSEQRAVTAP